MRFTLLGAGLVAGLALLGGCGGGEAPTTTADEGAPPLKVQFTASVEEETGGPFTFAWDFGDGGKSTEQNPMHTYDKVGEYTATLTVTNQKGNKGTDEIDIFVETDDDAGE
jgi:PKD repeat protein